jgi:hypothetical protein
MTHPIPASQVPNYFTHSGTLVYKILADGTLGELSTLDGGVLSVRIKGQRVLAMDIAWALHFGNWPKFPLVQLSTDPFDCRVLENIFPARLKRLRYRQTIKDGKFCHPLARLGFTSAQHCRADWTAAARAIYMGDVDNVLTIEAKERELRAAAGLVDEVPMSRKRQRLTQRMQRVNLGPKPSKPRAPEGQEYHWFKGEWRLVPVACHVADDYVCRLRAWEQGAVRAAFNPVYGNVWYYDKDGEAVHA